jgi:hypothetical protein
MIHYILFIENLWSTTNYHKSIPFKFLILDLLKTPRPNQFHIPRKSLPTSIGRFQKALFKKPPSQNLHCSSNKFASKDRNYFLTHE